MLNFLQCDVKAALCGSTLLRLSSESAFKLVDLWEVRPHTPVNNPTVMLRCSTTCGYLIARDETE